MLENSTHLLSKGGWPGPRGGGRTRGTVKAVPVVLNPWPQWLGPEPGRSPNSWAGGTQESGGLVTARPANRQLEGSGSKPCNPVPQATGAPRLSPPSPTAASSSTHNPSLGRDARFPFTPSLPTPRTCTQPRNLPSWSPRGRRQQDQQQQGTTNTGDSEGPGPHP